MRQMKHISGSQAHQSYSSIERRRMTRTSVSFGLMYSGIKGEDVLIGDGTVVDLSDSGLGIRGDVRVQVGMDLTLFLYLADSEDLLFVVEATVAWTKGHLFGVILNELSLRDGSRLQSFLRSQGVGQA